MFILNEDGVLISFDLSHVVKQNKYWFLYIFTDSDIAIWFIVVINVCAVIYLKFFRLRNNRLADITERRGQEINQVIRDIVRLNNIQQALGGQNIIDPGFLQPIN
jgi:hypothetical protein